MMLACIRLRGLAAVGLAGGWLDGGWLEGGRLEGVGADVAGADVAGAVDRVPPVAAVGCGVVWRLACPERSGPFASNRYPPPRASSTTATAAATHLPGCLRYRCGDPGNAGRGPAGFITSGDPGNSGRPADTGSADADSPVPPADAD